MANTTQKPPVRFELEDADYWIEPGKTLFDMLKPLDRAQFDGVILGAPSFVDIERRSTLPLAVLRAGTDVQCAALDHKALGVIVAIDLEDDRVRVTSAWDRGELEPPEGDPDPEAYGASVTTLELRELLELPWQPSRHVVYFVMRDRLSNSVEVRLDETGYRDEVVEQLKAQRRRAWRKPPAIWPVLPLADYQASAETPELPEQLGINLTVPRVVLLEPGAACKLNAAFRLRIRDRDLVAQDHPLRQASPPVPAIVEITLLAIGAQYGDAREFALRIPCLTPPERVDDDELTVTGAFALDLLRLGLTDPQTWFVYAFSRRAVGGPVTVALVDPTTLP